MLWKMGEQDIGFARGVMRGGRAWELVTFTQGAATLATITFSQKGMEHCVRADFRRLLTDEGLVEFDESDDSSGEAKPWRDDSGKLMWVVFVLVRDERGPRSRPIPILLPMSEY